MRFKTEKEETVHIIGRIVITAEVLNLIITPLAARLEMIEKIVFAIEDDDLKVYVPVSYTHLDVYKRQSRMYRARMR